MAIAMAATSIGMVTAAPDAEALERWLRVHNETSVALCFVEISHIHDSGWGADILGRTCLRPGRYRTVDPGWLQGYCRVDMRFTFADDDVVEERNFNICVESDIYITD